MSEQAVPEEWIGVGVRLRKARTAAGISVRELARRVDVSPGHISNVERGLASLSVKSLYAIVSELGISMDSLFDPVEAPPVASNREPAASGASHPAAPDAPESSLEVKGILLRGRRRPSIPLPTGTRWERLTPNPERGAEFIEVIYPPNPDGDVPAEFIQHPSREYGIVTQGSLTIQVGFDTDVLHAGDSIAFNSTTPHRYWNATSQEVRAVWFIWDAPSFGAESDHLEGPAAADERTTDELHDAGAVT